MEYLPYIIGGIAYFFIRSAWEKAMAKGFRRAASLKVAADRVADRAVKLCGFCGDDFDGSRLVTVHPFTRETA